MMLLPDPKRLMLGYLVGALMTSITLGLGLGLVIVFSIEGSDAVRTTENALSPAATMSFSTAALSTRPSCNAIKAKALASLHAGSRAIGVPEGAQRHYRCLHGSFRSRFVGVLRASSARSWNVVVDRSTTEGEEVRGPGLERHVQAVRRELAAVTLKGSIVEPVGELPASAGEVRPR